MRNAHISIFGRLEGKISFGKRRCRREDNIKMGAKWIEYEGVDWIHLTQDKGLMVDCCEHGSEPLVSINLENLLTSRATISFSRRSLFHGVSWLMKLNEMRWSCRIYGGNKCEAHLEELNVDGRITLRWTLEKQFVNMWNWLTQDRVQLMVFVMTMINFIVPKRGVS